MTADQLTAIHNATSCSAGKRGANNMYLDFCKVSEMAPCNNLLKLLIDGLDKWVPNRVKKKSYQFVLFKSFEGDQTPLTEAAKTTGDDQNPTG